MRKQRWFGVPFGLVALVFGLVVAVGELPARPDEPKTGDTPELGKGKRAQEFIAAFNKGDAKAVAGFWVPDGDYVDPAGRQFKGRAAIEKLYEKVFAGRKGAKLTVTVTSARTVSSDVALEDGITEVAPADGGPPTAGRFSAVLDGIVESSAFQRRRNGTTVEIQ